MPAQPIYFSPEAKAAADKLALKSTPATNLPVQPAPLSKNAKLVADAQALSDQDFARRKEFVGNLEDEVAIKQQAEGNIAKAAEVARQKARRTAANALLAARGSSASPSGARIAAMDATGTETAMNESSILAEAALSRQKAREEAAAAETDLTAKKQELSDEMAAAAGNVGKVDEWVRNIIDKHSGTVFTTDADRRKMIDEIRNKVLPSYTKMPAAMKLALAWIRRLETGDELAESNWSVDL